MTKGEQRIMGTLLGTLYGGKIIPESFTLHTSALLNAARHLESYGLINVIEPSNPESPFIDQRYHHATLPYPMQKRVSK